MDKFSRFDKHEFPKFNNLTDFAHQWLTEWQTVTLFRNLKISTVGFKPVYYRCTVDHNGAIFTAYQGRKVVGSTKIERDW